MREYITAQGDTWDLIALRVYGSERYMTVLIEANPEHQETVIFPAGVRLKVPEVTVPIPSTLPPWKRGES